MNILKYFASPKGRRFTFFASVGAAVGAFGIHFFPHTFLANNYHREFVASYKDGVERSVSETLRKRFEVAVEILKLSDFERKLIEPFMVSGFDCYHMGSTKFRYGAFVGIPVNYSYTSKSDVDKIAVMVRGKPVDWNSQGGLLLEQSLVLTPDEQVFGMAREIIQLQSNQVYLNSFYSSASIVGYYVLTSTINSKKLLFYRPLSLRVSFYAIASLFTFGVYSFLTDFTQVRNDTNTDEKLASLGRGMTETGVRFYDKLLKKNISCRELTGDMSEFTAQGNENFMIRHKRQPLTARKSYFELKLKELEGRKESSVTEEPTVEESPKQ